MTTNPIMLGHAVPSFSGAATSDVSFDLPDYRDQNNLVLYFYPKDSTPGCTTEGQDFRDHHNEFLAHDTLIFGISRDSMKRHKNFKAKQNFPFELISDPDEVICQLFDVIKLKNMFGRQVQGIERSTFLIDKKGILRQEWRKVKVKGHVDTVLDAVKTL